MENTVVEKEKKNLPWFITKIVLNVIFYIVIILLLLFSIMNINSGGKNEGFPNIFGKGFLSVQSDSMTRPNDLEGYDSYKVGSFSKGDLIYVDVINDKNINDLRVGDVITFKTESLQALNSHRIVYATYKDASGTSYVSSYSGIYTFEGNSYVQHNGSLPDDVTVVSISTQGDFTACQMTVYDPTDESKAALNNSLQSSAVDTFTVANFSSIKGVATGVSVGTGLVLENLQQNWLFYFVFPVLVFLLIEIFLVVKNIMDLKGHKNKASVEEQKQQMMLDLEAEKEKMRQQILAELQASNPSVVNKEETPTADEPQEETPAVEESTVEETPVEEASVEETPEEETIDEEFTIEAEEEKAEPATEEATKEETPVVEEEKVEEASQEPQTLEYVEEGTVADTTIALEPVKEAVEATSEEKVVKSTSAAKKTASGAKKPTTSKGSSTTTKASTTKKATTGTKTTATKKATTAKAKADGEATATKAPAKKASTTTKKTTSTAAKSTATKKTTTGTRKTTAAKAETKKDDVKTNKEESE